MPLEKYGRNKFVRTEIEVIKWIGGLNTNLSERRLLGLVGFQD